MHFVGRPCSVAVEALVCRAKNHQASPSWRTNLSGGFTRYFANHRGDCHRPHSQPVRPSRPTVTISLQIPAHPPYTADRGKGRAVIPRGDGRISFRPQIRASTDDRSCVLASLCRISRSIALHPSSAPFKSLVNNTLPVTHSFQRSNVQNFPYSVENREFRGVGGGGTQTRRASRSGKPVQKVDLRVDRHAEHGVRGIQHRL